MGGYTPMLTPPVSPFLNPIPPPGMDPMQYQFYLQQLQLQMQSYAYMQVWCAVVQAATWGRFRRVGPGQAVHEGGGLGRLSDFCCCPPQSPCPRPGRLLLGRFGPRGSPRAPFFVPLLLLYGALPCGLLRWRPLPVGV
jgi:hypothetical protein